MDFHSLHLPNLKFESRQISIKKPVEISFQIHYGTKWGEQIAVVGNTSQLGNNTLQNALKLDYLGNGFWGKTIFVDPATPQLSYRYLLVDNYQNMLAAEWEHPRTVDLSQQRSAKIALVDAWRTPRHPENGLMNAAFLNVIFQPHYSEDSAFSNPKQLPVLRFQIQVPQVAEHEQLCVLGNIPELGNWDYDQALLLENIDFPWWGVNVPVNTKGQIEYKYGIYDREKKRVTFLEVGDNRVFNFQSGNLPALTIISDHFFAHPAGLWKGSGVAIPVFSLRSASSFGVGAFSDIKLLVDWAKKVGMKMVQILPINDTSATYTWVDSYPYAAISVYALHPMYLDLTQLPGFENVAEAYAPLQEKLNALPEVDYEAVMKHKLDFARQIFKKQKSKLLKLQPFKDFLDQNANWLKPYAYFCALRDQYGTVDFEKWEKDQAFSTERMEKAAKPKSAHYDAIIFSYYLQFYLDQQLQSVTAYARANNIVLKGDIPIGIYRYSVDAWTQPQLYHMDGQAGAPPDPFSELGQNWGFPTYNWPEMAKDGYQWWQNRLKTLSKYFDAFRIDHILGFFRIWQVPFDQIEGTMGFFNPAIPISMQELYDRGIGFDYDRFCKPYITAAVLQEIFENDAELVRQHFLESNNKGGYQFKQEFDTQRKVKAYLAQPAQQQLSRLQSALFKLLSNIILIEDPKGGGRLFHPRIDFQYTTSYQAFNDYLQKQLITMYLDYFYDRQNMFWMQQAMTKLPAIKRATNMLICGEDLGMIPDSVPTVMQELDLLTLEIQRMSKNPQTEFLQAADVPYLSVCSPSTHDMSPIRLWWEESERNLIARFYYQELKMGGSVPDTCEPEVAERIIMKHLQLPSMWAVFPLQDLLGMSAELRHPDPNAERINVPAVAQHYWRYRLHIDIEALLKADQFNEKLAGLLKNTNR